MANDDLDTEEQPKIAKEKFACRQCGADMKFAPGTTALKCPYCGTENVITASREMTESRAHLQELDYQAQIEQAGQEQDTQEVITVKCTACAAETTLQPNVTADECPFCGTSLVLTTQSKKLLKPSALLPFKIAVNEAQQKFRAWINGLWFAPNTLKKYARQTGGLDGMYIPHWTYDSITDSNYTGERGEYYYVEETYTAVENGKQVTKTRKVRKTHWYPARGRVHNEFDDVIVPASNSLPRNLMQALEPWDLDVLVPYDDQYLSGFRTESYTVDLQQGFELAKQIMDSTIRNSIRKDIGGDEQRIHSVDTTYSNTTFKHILLPLWISAYRYRDKVYRFLINARTGEVQGERPWSWIKIAFAVLIGTGAIVGLIYLLQYLSNQ